MIDLCVVNYNTKPLLERLLQSLNSDLNDEKPWKLHISDNNSPDKSIDFIYENQEAYNIDTIIPNKNVGYSQACNYLAYISDSDIIGLLNADVWLTTADVLAIQELFDNNEDIHILGPKQRDEKGFIKHAGIVGTNTQPRHRGWNEYDPDDLLYKDRIKCVTVSGSAYFVRRIVWDHMTNYPLYKELFPSAIGAFLPTPHYYEETFCSYFARHLGYNVYYDGSVSIGHTWHASSPRPGEGVSEVDKLFNISRGLFREACDHLGIERD